MVVIVVRVVKVVKVVKVVIVVMVMMVVIVVIVMGVSRAACLPAGRSTNQQINKSTNTLPQVCLQQLAPGGIFQPFDGFFLDLSHPFACKAEFLPDFFQGMGMLAIEPEIKPDNIGFTIGQGR